MKYFIFLLVFPVFSFGQDYHKIDSLKNIIETSHYDTLVCHSYATWGTIIYSNKPDSAIILWETAIALAEKNLQTEKNKKVKDRYLYSIAQCTNNLGLVYIGMGKTNEAEKLLIKTYESFQKINNKEEIGNALNSLGYFYGKIGEIKKSIDFYEESLAIFKSINKKDQIAAVLTNLAFRYYDIGQVKKALKLNYESLKIKESLDNPKSIAYSYNNLAFIYNKQGDIERALEYFNKSLEYRLKVGDKNDISDSYNNIGQIYFDQKQYKIALDFFTKALKLAKESNYKVGLGLSLLNIGEIYFSLGENDKSLEYFFMADEIAQSMTDKRESIKVFNSLSKVYFKLGNYDKARSYATKSLIISQELGYPEFIKESSLLLSDILERQQNSKEALKMYKLHITMRDSLNNESTQKVTAQQQAKYEYEKQKTIDDAEYLKQIAIEKEAKSKQKVITYATAGGLILFVFFSVFVFNRLQVTKKQKVIIEFQKQEVEGQKEKVEEAHSELEVKNKEITDSIQYAKRIQNAILPPAKLVKEYLPESFILYKPKDIVAGDFYWMEHKDGNVLFAAADCTGHGVPGAMVSVVCNNGLNRSVREYGLIDPGKILDKTRQIVIEEFAKSEDEVKDGMDIALCVLKGNKLLYAGAHNPLWIIRGGELIETKANKQPIGQFDNPEPYKTHELSLQKGDTIYIFSDGYVDQFGGAKGKKFKSVAFRELLLSIQEKNMEEQQGIIHNVFESWKGNLEQIDDVCVVGVRM